MLKKENSLRFPLDLQQFSEDNPADEKQDGDGNQVKEPTPTESTVDEKKYTDKDIQSAQSKAKNEILKSLGLTSVEEGKNIINAKSQNDKEIASLKTSFEELKKEATNSKENEALAKLGVSEKHLEDLRILAHAKEGEETFFDKAKGILENNPQWKTAIQPTPLGPKQSNNPTPPSDKKSQQKW